MDSPISSLRLFAEAGLGFKALRESYKKGPADRSAGPSLIDCAEALAAVAHEAQQEHEHVHKVEVQVQRPHDDRLAHHVGALHVSVGALDLLRVVSGEASEDEHAKRADRQRHSGRLEDELVE